jgi:PAS domain S-box-containing protein
MAKRLSSYRYVLAGLGLAVFCWIYEAAVQGLVPGGGSQIGWSRALLPLMILGFSVYVQYHLNRQKRRGDDLEQQAADLRATVADTKIITDNTSSLIAILDKDLRCVYASPSHKILLGYAPEDIKKRVLLEIIHPDDRDRLSVLYAKGLSGKIDHISPLTYRLIDKDGRIRHADGTFDAIRAPNGELEKIVCVADDITEKVNIQKALSESEQRLRSIMDTAPIPIAEIDCSGRFLFVNRAYYKKFGYTQEDLRRMNVADFSVTPQEGEELMKLLAQLVANQPPPLPWEGRNRTRDGGIVDVVIDWNYKKDERDRLTGFITAITDITESKKTEAALRQSQQRYQALFDNMSAAIVVYQPIDDGRDFMVIDLNNAAETMENVSREAVIGKTVSEVFPGVKALGLFDVFQRVHQSGRPEGLPLSLYKEERTDSWRKNYVYKLPTDEIVAVYTDETDRVQAGEALRESESRFRSLVEYSADHVFMFNSDAEYLFSNDRLRRFGVVPPGSLIGKKVEAAYPPELAGRFRRLVTHVFKHGHTTSFEFEMKGRDGLSVFLNTLYPIYQDGRLKAVGGISRDITTRKRYEQELQQKTNELERTLQELRQTQRRVIDQERHRALSQMASGIAHDFNNSLTSIQGFSDLLLQSPDKINHVETVQTYVQLINTAARDAAQIVRRLRKFYRPSQDETLQAIDINQLIEEAVALTEPVWKSKAQARGASITIQKTLGENTVINANRAEITEVLTNLIFNAVDAMPTGGILQFATRREGDWVTMEISDNGIGMDAAVRQQCLNPFFTTKGEAGSGLGLATVQGIVTRLQGEITIHSEPGRGSTFRLRLPAAMPATVFSPSASAMHGDRSPLKILIVDDDAHQRFLLEKYLQKDNHRTETAVNGLDGMKKFNDQWYDLVITDLAMPELSGVDLAQKIKKTAPEKPIIMLTGFGDVLDAIGEPREAVDLILSKPVTLGQLREAISYLFYEKHDAMKQGCLEADKQKKCQPY